MPFCGILERAVEVFTLPAYCGMFNPTVKLKIEQLSPSHSIPFHSQGKDNVKGICTVYII
jgi:hypothetical protein